MTRLFAWLRRRPAPPPRPALRVVFRGSDARRVGVIHVVRRPP